MAILTRGFKSDPDQAASKLLTNADRWAIDAVFSRDPVDLAMPRESVSLLRQACAKPARRPRAPMAH